MIDWSDDEQAILEQIERFAGDILAPRAAELDARAKGLSERAVLGRHAFPNAFAPTLTLMGVVQGGLLGGIAVTETVFTLPGLRSDGDA